jgi:hypothetical protein
MSKKDLKFTKEENRFIDNISDILYDKEKVIEYIAEKYDDYFYMMPNGEYKKSVLHKIYENYLNRDIDCGHRNVQITKSHIEFLNGLPSDLIKRLFYSLIVRAAVKPHSSGWISLDYENTIKYGLNDKDAKKAKIEIYSQCTPYGFNCRVSGSTKPVLCFQLPEFEESEVVFEFEDGCAAQMYEEVINYGDNNSHK